MNMQPTRLSPVVGEGVMDIAGTLAEPQLGYARDQWPQAIKLPPEDNVLVVHPATTEAVSDIVRHAAQEGLRVVAYGAGSNVVGAIDGGADRVVSLENLAGMIKLDERSQTVTVGAGMLGGNLEDALNVRGFTLGHHPQSLRISTVGGWISTRATGTYSACYGGIERLVCGLRMVTADGEVLTVAPRVRPAGGLDLIALMTGSEGSLGIVTEVTMLIHRLPAERRVCASFADFASGLEAQRELIQRGLPIGLVRLYNEAESAAVTEGSGEALQCLLVVTTVGASNLIDAQEDAIAAVVTEMGGQPLTARVADHWFQTRFDAAGLMETRNAATGDMFDTIEVSLPWATAAACAEELEKVLGAASQPFFLHSSHIYLNGTCLYLMLYLHEADDVSVVRTCRRVWEQAMDIVEAHGGTVGHHHGIGAVRSQRYLATAEGQVHQRLKNALDPRGVLYARLLDGMGEAHAADVTAV